MLKTEANPVSQFLPLLTNPQPEVRRQACAILLTTYGKHALTFLRRMAESPDPQIRSQARESLQSVAEIVGIVVKAESFEGMYIECLGRLRVYVDDREVRTEEWKQHEGRRAGWQRVQACFAYLIHCGRRGASRTALGEAVWGGAVSVASITRTLAVLQQVLASISSPAFAERALVLTREHYILAPELYHTDVQIFERTFDLACHVEETQGFEAAEPLYTQALQVYGGPYMVDIPRSAQWSQPQRDHLLNSFVITAERLAEYSYSQQDYQHCVAICSQVLNVEETADDLVAWLLHAYSQLGLYGEIEHAYQRYLRTADINPFGIEGQEDIVVQTYQELNRVRALGEYSDLRG